MIDLTGKRFGMLLAVAPHDNDFVREEVSRLLDFSRPYSARNTYRKKEAN